jgi:hypothetical protein
MRFYWNHEINILIKNSDATRTFSMYGIYWFGEIFTGILIRGHIHD